MHEISHFPLTENNFLKKESRKTSFKILLKRIKALFLERHQMRERRVQIQHSFYLNSVLKK